MVSVAAIDLGASSGRVLVGHLEEAKAGPRLRVEETARFANRPLIIPRAGGLDTVWDMPRLWEGVLAGLRHAGHLDAVAADTWAVDYARLDQAGRLLGLPESYRSPRTEGQPQLMEDAYGRALYSENGLQVQPFNTIYQLAQDQAQGRVCAGEKQTRGRIGAGRVRALLLPDLFTFWLSGKQITEVTNASSTGLIDPRTRAWSQPICEFMARMYGVDPRELFAPLTEPGSVVGEVRRDALNDVLSSDGEPAKVVAVGSHDTASAVAGIPAEGVDFAYISSGTWSLVGLELARPVMGEEARSANFTNELGVSGTVRFLKNIMGMWVQTQCLAQWKAEGIAVPSWDVLDAQTEALPVLERLIDINDPAFFAPGPMTGRIDKACREGDYPEPRTPAEYMRCIYDSLVLAYRDAILKACELSGKQISRVHLVGGGANNRILCQATADATDLPVIAGPAEGTALGNMSVQLQAIGVIGRSLDEGRTLIRRSVETITYEPRAEQYRLWEQAEL